MRIEIYGGSDDLIEVRVDGKHKDEHNAYGGDPYMATLDVSTIGGSQGVKVHAIYDGCWSFAVGQIEEGRSLPRDWTFAVEQEHDYSTRLIIVTPHTVIVTLESKERRQ